MIWSVGQFLKHFRGGFLKLAAHTLTSQIDGDLRFNSRNRANAPMGVPKKWGYYLGKVGAVIGGGWVVHFYSLFLSRGTFAVENDVSLSGANPTVQHILITFHFKYRDEWKGDRERERERWVGASETIPHSGPITIATAMGTGTLVTTNHKMPYEKSKYICSTSG